MKTVTDVSKIPSCRRALHLLLGTRAGTDDGTSLYGVMHKIFMQLAAPCTAGMPTTSDFARGIQESVLQHVQHADRCRLVLTPACASSFCLTLIRDGPAVLTALCAMGARSASVTLSGLSETVLSDLFPHPSPATRMPCIPQATGHAAWLPAEFMGDALEVSLTALLPLVHEATQTAVAAAAAAADAGAGAAVRTWHKPRVMHTGARAGLTNKLILYAQAATPGCMCETHGGIGAKRETGGALTVQIAVCGTRLAAATTYGSNANSGSGQKVCYLHPNRCTAGNEYCMHGLTVRLACTHTRGNRPQSTTCALSPLGTLELLNLTTIMDAAAAYLLQPKVSCAAALANLRIVPTPPCAEQDAAMELMRARRTYQVCGMFDKRTGGIRKRTSARPRLCTVSFRGRRIVNAETCTACKAPSLQRLFPKLHTSCAP